MEQNEANEADYPRGRGYGHDYMRGGEVFGGYGYQARDEYERPRGGSDERSTGDAEAPPAAGGISQAGEGDGEAARDGKAERFPQDDRAGGWPVPHDVIAAGGDAGGDAGAPHPPTESTDAPVPQLEHTFGDSGGNRSHSRSYYVTQAQLQQRVLRS